MTELSRNLIAAAREGLAPDPAVAARVRARVAAAVGATATLAPVKARGTTAKLGAAKLGAAALAIGIVAALALLVSRSPERTAVPHVTAAGTVDDEPTSRVHVVAGEPGQAPAMAATEADRPARSTSPTTPSATPAPALAVATLAREVELIDRAMLALRRGAAPAALDAIGAFERETRGHGQMAEDAAAVAIEAHCQLKHDVAARLAAFDRAYPSSAQRARLRDACR